MASVPMRSRCGMRGPEGRKQQRSSGYRRETSPSLLKMSRRTRAAPARALSCIKWFCATASRTKGRRQADRRGSATPTRSV
jgi:hypothetical protein